VTDFADDGLDEALKTMQAIGRGDLYYTEDGVGVMRCMMCRKCGNIVPMSQVESCRHPNPDLPPPEAP